MFRHGVISMMGSGGNFTNMGFFAGGMTTVLVALTDRYAFATDAVTVGTVLNSGVRYAAGAGTSSVGIVGGGTTDITTDGHAGALASTQKRLYAGDTVVSGGNLTHARDAVGACGNSTIALFSGGVDAGLTVLATTDVYTYSGDTVAAGTAIPSSGSVYWSGAGNATVGILAGGYSGGTNSKRIAIYTYAGSTFVNSANLLSNAAIDQASFGTTTNGFFAGGFNTVSFAAVDKYNYGADTIAATTALSLARSDMSGTGNTLIGVVGGGLTDTPAVVATTDKHTYAGDGNATGTNLGTARNYLAATSSTPGGF